MFAVGYVLNFGLPDEMLEQTIAMINAIPEDDLRKRIRRRESNFLQFPFSFGG